MNTIKYISILLFILVFFQDKIEAQDFPIIMSVGVTEEGIDLSSSNEKLLLSKLKGIARNYGMATASSEKTDFSLLGDIQFDTPQILEDFQKIFILVGEAHLVIRQNVDGKEISQVSLRLKGSGSSEAMAVKSALRSIKTKALGLKSFIEESKKEIVEYYEGQCDHIIAEAEKLNRLGNHKDALKKLVAIPSGIGDCETKSMELLEKTYLLLQNQKCSELLLEAKGKISSNQFGKAVDILSLADPSSSCYKDVLLLMDSIKDEVDEEDMREWDLLLEVYKDETELEKARLEAIQAIGVAMYSGEEDVYNYIIK